MPTTTELRVLHALRLMSFAETGAIASAAGIGEVSATTMLDQLADDDLIRHKQGTITGWMLLPAGRKRGEELLAAELDASGHRTRLEALYQRFLERNQPFLALCTDWQTRVVDGERVRNDHGDAAYDAAVIQRLNAVDDDMAPIWRDLGDLFDRFERYEHRFATARQRLNDGDADWFASPRVESYHTVWFELHEDLLASLGIERAKEVHT